MLLLIDNINVSSYHNTMGSQQKDKEGLLSGCEIFFSNRGVKFFFNSLPQGIVDNGSLNI